MLGSTGGFGSIVMIDKLFTQSAFYGAVALISRGANVFLLLGLTLVLDPADFGALSIILTLSGLAVVIVPLAITQGLALLAASADAQDKRNYASSAFRFTAVAVLVWLIAAELVAEPLCRWIIGPERYVPVFRIGLVVIAVNIAFDFIQNQFRWEFRLKEYALVSLSFALPTLIFAFLFAFLWPDPLQGILIGQVIGGTAAIVWGLWRLRNSLSGTFEWPKVCEMLRLTAPLVPASLAFLYSQYAGRFILNDTVGLDAVGSYSFASQIAGIAAVALVGVQNAVIPLIMSNHQDPETPRVLSRAFEFFTGAGVLLALGLGLVTPVAIAAVGNPLYRSAAPLVVLLSLSVVVSAMYVFLPGFLVAKRPWRQMWVSFAGVAISVSLNYFLSVRFGTLGAAAATLLASVLMLSLWYVFSKPLYPMRVRMLTCFCAVFLAAVAGEAALFFSSASYALAIAAKTAAFALVLLFVTATGLISLRDLHTAGASLLSRFRVRTR